MPDVKVYKMKYKFWYKNKNCNSLMGTTDEPLLKNFFYDGSAFPKPNDKQKINWENLGGNHGIIFFDFQIS